MATNPATTQVPPLANGDRLTRAEFERRYAAMPEVKKAELVNRVVYMPSPTRFQSHGEPHAFVVGWLAVFAASTPGIRTADNTTVRLDHDNEIQPDALLRIETRCGGQSRIGEDDYVEGAPELIVEVAASSAAYDLHDKKTVCRRHGVQEYVVWQIFEKRLDWFVLEDGDYLCLEPDEKGLLRSRVMPGLWLDVAALLSGDLATVLDRVQRGAASEDHGLFVERLRQAESS